jgi:hypothetical protein
MSQTVVRHGRHLPVLGGTLNVLCRPGKEFGEGPGPCYVALKETGLRRLGENLLKKRPVSRNARQSGGGGRSPAWLLHTHECMRLRLDDW